MKEEIIASSVERFICFQTKSIFPKMKTITTCPVCKTETKNTEKYCTTCGETFWQHPSTSFQKILNRRTEIQGTYFFNKSIVLQNIEKLEVRARQLASDKEQSQRELAQLEEQLNALDAELESQKSRYANLEVIAAMEHEWLEYLSFLDTYLKPIKHHQGINEVTWSLAGTRLSVRTKTHSERAPALILALFREKDKNSAGTEHSRLFINLQKQFERGASPRHWVLDLKKIRKVIDLSKFREQFYFSLQSEHQETELQLKIENQPLCPFPL